MAATNLYMNWTGVTVTPSGGSAITLTEILDVEPDISSKQEKFYGDNLRFPRLILNTEKTRSLTLTGGDVWKLLSIPDDTPCTIVAILNDAKNGTGTGAITVTLANAVRNKLGIKAPNNKFAGTSVMFDAYGSSGDVDPLTVSQAS